MATTYKGKTYDDSHGSPFDRGMADSYYGRSRNPHFFMGSSYMTPEIIPEKGSAQYKAYMAGYDYNEESGNRKDWGR